MYDAPEFGMISRGIFANVWNRRIRFYMKLDRWLRSLAAACIMGIVPAVHAQGIVASDLSDDLSTPFVGVGNDMAETFSTGTSSGDISQVILSLDFAGASQTGVFLYTTTGAPTSYETLQIGTVSTNDYIGQNSYGQNLYLAELNAGVVAANPLASGTDYAISVEGQGAGDNLYWNSTASGSASTGAGSFLGAYYVSHGSWVSAPSQMMGVEVDEVPEPSGPALAICSVIVLLAVRLINRSKGPV